MTQEVRIDRLDAGADGTDSGSDPGNSAASPSTRRRLITRRRQQRATTSGQAAFPGRVMPFLLLAPTLVIVAIFLYYPAGSTAVLSFKEVAFLGTVQRFVGFDNYAAILGDAESLAVLARTAVLSLIVIVGSMALALGVAALLNQRIRGTRVYRLLLIWPLAMSTAISGLIFLALFNPTFGLVNRLLRPVGLDPHWFEEPLLAQAVVVLALIWARFGYNLVFYTAAYQNLSRDQLDAALVDGATAWQRFRHVTFPLLTPMTLFLLVTNTTFAFFDSFAMIHVVTQGGPLDSTTVLMYDIYKNAFELRRTGFAASQVMLLFLVVIGLTLVQFRASRRTVHYGN